MKKIIITILTAFLLLSGSGTAFLLLSGANTVHAATNTVLDFDADADAGKKDYVVVSDNAVLDQANRLSLSVWIEPDNAPGEGLVEYILYRHDNYYLKIDENRKIVGSVHTDSERITSASAITCDGAAWTHIEMTYDREADGDTDLKLYINGVLDATANYSTAITASADALYIGSDSTPANWFDGQIDAVRLYQYARSASDVRLDYNEGYATYLGARTLVEDLTFCADDPASCMDYGLVGSWGMDEGTGTTAYNSADGTFGLNSGTLTGGPKWTTEVGLPIGSPTSNAGALYFDGASDYIDCGNDESLNITDEITISAWVKPETAVDGRGEIVNAMEASQFSLINYKPHIQYKNISGIWVNLYADNPLTLGVWSHITAILEPDGGGNNTAKLYVNGNIVKQNTLTGLRKVKTQNLKIGAYSSTQERFKGSIADVRIYNRALSAEEVRWHYNRGGPVAEWNFDEGEGQTAYDESSNNNDGQLGATAAISTDDPTWVEGKYGGALSFDGGDYVDCGNGSSLDITDAITIEAWVKKNQNPTVNHIHFVARNNYVIHLRLSSTGIIRWYAEIDGNYEPCPKSSVLNNDEWYHVVGTYDKDGGNDNHRLYINGVLVDSKTKTGTIADTAGTNLLIGKGGIGFFNGSIDSVRIYNRALSAEEVRKEYNGGKGVWFR